MAEDFTPVPTLERRRRVPHMSLKDYDERARITDEINAMDGQIAAVRDIIEGERSARVDQLDVPVGGYPPSDAETLLEKHLAAHALLTKQVNALGGKITPPAPVVIAAPVATPEPEAEPGVPLPQAVAASMLRFRAQTKRIRDKADAIARKDAPDEVIIAELDALLAKA